MELTSRKNILIFILSAAVVMGIGVYFRLYPLQHQGAAYARDLATKVIRTRLQQQIRLYIEEHFPTLSESVKSKMELQNYEKIIHENSSRVKGMIDDGVTQLLSSGLGQNTSFLLEADSYYFYGLTENIAHTGAISPIIKNGRYFSSFMLAPEGKWEPLSLHPYLGFYLHKIISFFMPDVRLIDTAKIVPILVATLSVIPFLLICYRLGIGSLPAFISAIFFILSPFFTQRTTYGWYTTNAYSIFFPLLILLFIITGLQNLNDKKKTIAYAIAASCTTALYELFWHGWNFIFIIILLSLPCVLFFGKKFTPKGKPKNIIIFYAGYAAGVLFWICLLVSPMTFVYTFQEGWATLNSFLGAHFDLWPNIFLTVGETQNIDFSKLSFLVGGNAFHIYLAIAGCLWMLIRSIRRKEIASLAFSLLLCIFICSFLYLSLKALRFAIQLTVPVTIGFALFVEYSYRGLAKLINRSLAVRFEKTAYALHITLIITLCASTAVPLYAADQICGHIHPVYNQSWEDILITIRDKTPPNAIINTWWCPGHFITSVAKRRVTVEWRLTTRTTDLLDSKCPSYPRRETSSRDITYVKCQREPGA